MENEEIQEDKMSLFALHTRLHKIEMIIYSAGTIGVLIRFLIKLSHSWFL